MQASQRVLKARPDSLSLWQGQGERPRRRLLDLAKSLHAEGDAPANA